MRFLILCILLAAVANLQWANAQTPATSTGQASAVPPPSPGGGSPLPSLATPPASAVTQLPPFIPSVPKAATVDVPLPTSAAAPTPIVSIAPPADIASLTAKEILAANNAVVSQVATMYQHFGLLITVLVSLAAGFATYMSYVARRSVKEFVDEWDKKLQTRELQIDSTLQRARDAELTAAKSAVEAEKQAASLKSAVQVVTHALTQVDQLRTQVEGIRERHSVQAGEAHPPGGIPLPAASDTEAAAPTPHFTGPVIDEPLSQFEEASIVERLKGRLPPEPPSDAS